MIRLLDSCIRVLAEQGMNKLIIDAVKGGDEGFQSMGELCPKTQLCNCLLTQTRVPKMGTLQRRLARRLRMDVGILSTDESSALRS